MAYSLKLLNSRHAMTSPSRNHSTSWRLSLARNITSSCRADLTLSSVRLSAKRTLLSSMFATWSSRLSWELAGRIFRKTMELKWSVTWLTFGVPSAHFCARTTEFWLIESRSCATTTFNGKESSRTASFSTVIPLSETINLIFKLNFL